jgi:tetratricopeptide (TPR) repeat protein
MRRLEERPVRPSSLLAAVAFCFLAAASLPALAEAIGKLHGTVVDRAGVGVEKAEIVLTNDKFRTRILKGKSKKDGKYVFPFVETGPYQIAVNVPGHKVLRVVLESRGDGETEVTKNDWILSPKDTVPVFEVPFTGSLGFCELDLVIVKEDEFLDAYRALRQPGAGEAQAQAGAAPGAGAPGAETPAPRLTGDVYDQGRQLAQSGKHAEAIPLFQKALEEEPDNQAVIYALGLSSLEVGNAADAEAAFQKLLALNPEYPAANYYLGRAQAAGYKNAAAIASYRKEIDISPDKKTNLLEHIAQVQMEMAKTQPAALEQARLTLEEIRTADPKNANALSQLAEIYRQQGKRQEQEEMYRLLAEADPQNADVTFFNLGAIAFNANRREEAANNFRKALEVNPKHADAHYQLAQCLVGMGKFPEAVAHYEQYLTLEPSGKRSDEVRKVVAKLKG